ncbi:22291_t:CDS:2 [Gigaspora margarita]|uniref:22291_t:CDS:1 n=1 Tax=Gigaspora margarita TaxID=4874 RepID=A0ABN7UQ40_GIGMA|nr:22291_t:CDS:2 [Gigaspora margarita]
MGILGPPTVEKNQKALLKPIQSALLFLLPIKERKHIRAVVLALYKLYQSDSLLKLFFDTPQMLLSENLADHYSDIRDLSSIMKP